MHTTYWLKKVSLNKSFQIFRYSILALFICISSCKKDSETNDGNNNTNGINNDGTTNDTPLFVFLNNNYNSSALITYTNGDTETTQFLNGSSTLKITSGNRVIKSITPKGELPITIGRKEGKKITLNYNGGKLMLRPAIDNYTPIGSFDEFQLINTDKTTLAGKYRLDADLDLMSQDWKPLGGNNYPIFTGVLDGNEHSIENLVVDIRAFSIHTGIAESYKLGLFGEIDATSAQIQNLTIASGKINANSSSGSFSVEAEGGVGAIVGKATFATGKSLTTDRILIQGCTNNAEVTGSPGHLAYYSAAGVIGLIEIAGNTNNFHFSISNCRNNGTIKQYNVATGGVIGAIAANNEDVKITDCTNTGAVTGGTTGDGGVGGVVGHAVCTTLTNCSNTGDVTGNGIPTSIGGVAGIINAYSVNGNYSLISVSNCTNSGKIKGGVQDILGGVVGNVFRGVSNFENCSNTGSITGEKVRLVGGVVGRGEVETILNCYNKGTILINSRYETGTIAGGIIGSNLVSGSVPLPSPTKLMDNCYNSGSITVTAGEDGNPYSIAQVAGLAVSGTGIIRGSFNSGNLTGPTGVAGIVGTFSGDLVGCYNSGKITGNFYSQGRIAGLVGNCPNSKIYCCYNSGEIGYAGTRTSYMFIAGIAAYSPNSAFTACYNTGVIASYNGVNVDPISNSINSDASCTACFSVQGTNKTQKFSNTIWPSISSNLQWGLGDGSGDGKYWKSLGNWNNDNPIYPQLYYQ